MSFLGGLQAGVQFGQNRDLRQQQQQVLQQRQTLNQNKIDEASAKSEQEAVKNFQSLLGDTVTYVKTLPLEQRAEAAKAYMGIRQADPEVIGRLEQSGYLSPQFLSDQSLDGLLSSMRQEQVLKDKEVLLGRDGQPVYSNRYNAPQVVADGSALVGDDGKPLFTNEQSPDLPEGMQMGANGPEYIPGYLDAQERLKAAGRPTTSVTVGTGSESGLGRVLNSDELKTIGLPEGTVAQLDPKGNIKIIQESEKTNYNKSKAGMASMNRTTDLVVSELRSAIEQANGLTTGLGSLTKALPGSPAADLKARLDTIQANIGFDKLQDMRNNSPTGGALGQVSEREIELLQAVQGSLSQAQSNPQFVENLSRLLNELETVRAERIRLFDEQYSQFGGSGISEQSAGGGASDPLGIR